MGINPGGRLDLGDIIGRDREIARYWKVLHRQGLILAAERRIGKTHIVLKMHETGHPGFVTIYQELEAVHSLTELVRALYRAVSHTFLAWASSKRGLSKCGSASFPSDSAISTCRTLGTIGSFF